MVGLKKARPRNDAAIADVEAEIVLLVKQGREASAKAAAIESAVYDLKAVNPNRKAVADSRTPEDLLDSIEVRGVEVAAALASLRALLSKA